MQPTLHRRVQGVDRNEPTQPSSPPAPVRNLAWSGSAAQDDAPREAGSEADARSDRGATTVIADGDPLDRFWRHAEAGTLRGILRPLDRLWRHHDFLARAAAAL